MKDSAEKKRVLMPGGTCELALCLGTKLIAQGWTPVLTWRDQTGKRKIESFYAGMTGQFDTRYLDLSDPSSLESLQAEATEGFAAMVDFAQGDYESLIAAGDDDRVRRYIAENVAARALLLKHVVRGMVRRRRGRLVFVSSSAAALPAAGQGYYAAAKIASEALYKNCGLELGGKGITSVILRVGYVSAGRGKAFHDAKPEAVTRVPLRRTLAVEEVAETLCFLLAPAAEGFNATVLTMDGGLSAGKAEHPRA